MTLDPQDWEILVTPTDDGFSIREDSGDAAAALVCSEVSAAITKTLNSMLQKPVVNPANR